MVRRVAWIVTCILVVGVPGLVRADSIEDIQKKLVESHAKLKSYACKMKMVQNFDMGQGNKMQSDYAGTTEWMRKDDKFALRTDLKGTAIQSFGGQDNKMDMSVTMVCDGDTLYTLSTQMGQTMATKQKPDATLGGDPKKIMDDIVSKHNVKVMPDDKVDGETCFVIETTPKDPADAANIAKTIMYFRKDIGVIAKTVGMDKDGKEVFTNTSSEFKINSDIAADRFVFKAPEGVQVMDMTGSQPHGGG
ncbi:MAG: hypothetical protein Q7R41_03405 [Phycisphaerales bacterium]|nr:hypothetical protein [Phycisphaerales bacterium]